MRPLKALALGAAACALVLYTVAVAVAVTADARGWGSFSLDVGPLTLLAFDRNGATTTFEAGTGIAVLAAVGGVANALAAVVLLRRRRR